MYAEVARIPTPDGLTLDGLYYRPQVETRPGGPAAFLLIHGLIGNAFMPIILHYAQGLARAGYGALSLNTRAHDIISLSDPYQEAIGVAYEVVDDCRQDFRGALDWLEGQGYSSLGLLGHSLGAVKVLYYAAQEEDSRVRAMIASSPVPISGRMRGEGLGPALERAKRLVEEGRDRELLRPEEVGGGFPLSAVSFLDKYGPEERYYAPKWIGQILCPILFLAGSREKALAPFVQKLGEQHSHPATRLALIQGADHSYLGQRDAALKEMLNWLAELV